MAYWNYATELLTPIAHIVQSVVLGGHVVGIDDTKVDFLDEADRGKRRRGHLWAFANAGGMIAYSFTRTWKAEEVAPWIQAVDGFIQVDDYKGYSTLIRGPDDEMCPLNDKSQPLLVKLDEWIANHEDKLRPTELLANARNYAQHQQPFFRQCFTDGRFEIDNGDVERGMRRIAMGRRNWLFVGASTGAPRLAVAYTLVESCRRLGLPVYEYLCDVLRKIDTGWPMRRIIELTPFTWGCERGLLQSPG